MTVIVTEGAEDGGETPSSPTAAAVEAVEVLAAAHEAGRMDGLGDGLLIARLDAMAGEIATIRSEQAETRGMLVALSETVSAQSAVTSEIIAAVVEAEEEPEVVVSDETTEVEPEPVVDKTPSRKRTWA